MLIIMHSLPGAGKSTLAKELAKTHNAVIVSADHYFETPEGYNFNPKKLGAAHSQCRDRCNKALKNGKSVVVDNTNLTYTECKPYIEMAKTHGVSCVIMEPTTDWKNDPEQCAEKNQHGVPVDKIRAMQNKMESVKSIWAKAYKELA